MIEYSDVMPIGFLKKLPFYGSYKGMRYKIEIVEKSVIRLSVWPGPLGFDNVDASLIKTSDYSPDEEGRKQAVDYLNDYYKTSGIEWKEGL